MNNCPDEINQAFIEDDIIRDPYYFGHGTPVMEKKEKIDITPLLIALGWALVWFGLGVIVG